MLESARRGSNESLGKVLEICRQYLLLVANRELDEQLQAKGGGSDLVQETFFEAQRDFEKFSGSTQDEMLAWLRQILLHNVQNFRRFWLETEKRNAGVEIPIQEDNSSRQVGPELTSPQQTPSQWAIKKERIAAIDTALARLPLEYRQVIVLRNQQHLSFEEISGKLGRTADSARKLWARAVEKLQEELGHSDDSSSQ
ncbi:MAG TPA: sigma-70 family RNA polymerase sigma factor [Pirellulaceae bacterium]|nr:sigma-70 family RNA polymerase sigma factor [Pirellulaceae bacterium]